MGRWPPRIFAISSPQNPDMVSIQSESYCQRILKLYSPENPNGKFLFIQIMTLIVKLLKVSTDPVGGFED